MKSDMEHDMVSQEQNVNMDECGPSSVPYDDYQHVVDENSRLNTEVTSLQFKNEELEGNKRSIQDILA